MDISKDLKALITASNSGKKIPALNIIENSPYTAAILSKLHGKERHVQHDSDGNRKVNTPNQQGLSDISRDVAQKATDNENILQLFPELEEAIRILVNGTLAPKDLNSTEINYSVPTDLKVSALTGKLLPIVQDTLSKDFKLKEMLPDMLYLTLGVDGSYPMIVIPESSVDDMINDNKSISTESLVEVFGNGTNTIVSKGFLGDNNHVAPQENRKENITFESFVQSTKITGSKMTDNRILFKTKSEQLVDTKIRITDNFDILKFPEIVKIKREEQVNQTIANSRGSVFHNALEDISSSGNYGSRELNDIQLTQLLYKNNLNIRNVTRKIKTSDETTRYNIGAPLTKLLPAESVIPVALSGDKKNHIAYFVLLDGLGNPVTKDGASSVFEDFRRNQMGFKQGGSNLASHLIQRTADSFTNSCNDVTFQQMQKICTDIIETDFLARLRNGIYGEDVSLVDNTAFYDILLSRMFKEQYTQVLFVPASLLTYFHYKLRKNGTGKTLLEDSLVLNSLRSVMLFANVNRSVVNSMGKTEVEITVDENDPNKQKTLEIAKHEAIKTRESQALPATISPTDIQKFLSRAQMYFHINAVPGLPTTALKFSESNTQYVKPDTDLMEVLDKKAVVALGVPPELVSTTEQVEFATNIIANNLRLSKQINTIQEKFQPQITKFARSYCMNHGTVVERIEKVIKENLADITQTKEEDEVISQFKSNEDLLVKLLAREFLSNFELNFSRPDTVTLKTQMEAFDEFESAVDKAINYYLSDDILSEATSGQVTGEQISLVRNSVKAYLIRDFLKKNAILPQLFDIVKTDDEGKPDVSVFTASSSHASSMTNAIGEFLKRVVPVAEGAQSDMEVVTGGQELGSGPSASSSSGSSGGGDSSGDDTSSDEGGGDDDLGMPEMPDFDNL